MAMQDRQGQHPVLRIAEEAPKTRRPYLARLQVEQAGYHLKIILHAMMDFAEHMIALLQARSQLALAAGDCLCHLVDSPADGDELRGPCPGGLQRDGLPACDPARELLDVAKRTHNPAIGAKPDGEKTCGHAQHDQSKKPPVGKQLRKRFLDRHGGHHEQRVAQHRQHMKLVLQAVLAELGEHRLVSAYRLGNPPGDRQHGCRLRPSIKRDASPVDKHGTGGRSGGAIGKALQGNFDRAHAGQRAVSGQRYRKGNDRPSSHPARKGGADRKIPLVVKSSEDLAVAQCRTDGRRRARAAHLPARIGHHDGGVLPREFLRQTAKVGIALLDIRWSGGGICALLDGIIVARRDQEPLRRFQELPMAGTGEFGRRDDGLGKPGLARGDIPVGPKSREGDGRQEGNRDHRHQVSAQ